ncbi:uncharacterized protein LOC119652380 isoform X1 [Hermetia illucens]|uniref:uncharacterized protein LOC119652380 isoform X1 n=1 Tax=Hermetia illucens TaxID=343691 RepID=UPI0018CC6505|nr:uncharacterized protein LOC119652380 isoform X1 [Hermetia illucens]
MGDFGEKAFQFEGLMSTILRLKNINNNGQDASCCELNGCHAMKPCDAQADKRKLNGDYDGIQEVLNENGANEAGDMATGRFNDEDIPAARSNNSSTSNSTGNLSISQEDYDDDDEVIFLANQQFADDEISEQSDDCVYAYRGADFDALEYRNNNNVDDETDFLEMDFEPDPASEIDNTTNECHTGCRNYNAETSADEILLPIQMLDEAANGQKIRSNFNSNCLQPNAAVAPDDWRNAARNQNNISTEGEGDAEVPEHFKFTGAKPKKQLADRCALAPQPASPRKQLLPAIDTKGKDEIPARSPIYVNGDAVTSDPDEPCLDCLENEFLSTTVGRKMEATFCRKCRRRRANTDFERKAVDTPNGFGREFMPFDDSRLLSKSSAFEVRYPNQEDFVANQSVDSMLLKRSGKESVTFSSVNVDEKVIIQALDHINVSFDKTIIKKHFENLNNFQPHFDNVTELILYTSKRNCDYKKIIKLVKLACNDEVDIKFTRDANVSKETEIVQVRSCDILEMWTIQQQNLEQLKRLNKKFIQMNVLGKVINLIRHAQQRNTKSIEEEFIIVPQYYKTGYICIIKK